MACIRCQWEKLLNQLTVFTVLEVEIHYFRLYTNFNLKVLVCFKRIVESLSVG